MSLVTHAPTMTSLELLELVNAERAEFGESIVRRNDFNARIRDELDGEHYESFVVDNGNGTASEAYRLTVKQCMYVAMRESKGVRRSVQEKLDRIEKPADPMQALADPATLRQMLLGYTEQVLKLEAQVAAAAPAVAFVDKFVHAEGLKGFREVCKLLKANESRFTEFVLAKKIMYRLSGRLTAHQQHIDAGRFEVRAGVATANDHAYTSTKFTPKGVNWIAGEWAKHCLAAELVEA